MANLPESDEWVPVYQLELTDPVVGGPPNEQTKAGADNIPHLHLVKRTAWLKARVDALMTQIVAASTAVAGIVRLSTATNSASTTEAATPSAVKAVADAVATRAQASVTVTGAGLVTGGGDLTGNRTLLVSIPTQPVAEAGVDNSTAMTPLTTAWLIAARIASGGLQAGSAILSAISALASAGMIVRTGAGAIAARTLTAGTGGIAITNGNGVAGDPTVSFGGALGATGVTTSAANDGGAAGTYTPSPAGGNMRTIANNGAFTLAAPAAAGDYTMVVLVTNSATAGAVTMTGFTRVSGEAFTLTSGHRFFVYVTKVGAVVSAHVQGLQ